MSQYMPYICQKDRIGSYLLTVTDLNFSKRTHLFDAFLRKTTQAYWVKHCCP